MAPVRPVLEGLVFPECLRWHEGLLWFTDNYGKTILRVDLEKEESSLYFSHEDDLAGLGFLPNGDVLVVAQNERRLLRVTEKSVEEYADLSSLAGRRTTDMIVAVDGTAFVDTIEIAGAGGSAHGEPDRTETSPILRVSPSGDLSIAADDLLRPNGLALTDDGRTLVVAESFGARLSAFSVEADRLADRRVFAPLEAAPGADQVTPDGICLDVEGAVWIADPFAGRIIRVREGGEVLETVHMPPGQKPWCCVLGGEDRRTLCVASSVSWGKGPSVAARDGRISTVRVEVAGSGLPSKRVEHSTLSGPRSVGGDSGEPAVRPSWRQLARP